MSTKAGFVCELIRNNTSTMATLVVEGRPENESVCAAAKQNSKDGRTLIPKDVARVDVSCLKSFNEIVTKLEFF